MISVFEQRDQLMALERRRQEIAAQQRAPAQHAPAITAQVAAPLAAGMPVAGYAAPAAALKASEPDVTKPGRPPSVPKPEPEHIAWAKRVMNDGYQASVRDQVDAGRILDAAGLNPDDFHAGKPADDAPPGARAIASAHLAREQALTDPDARKSYDARGITAGPDEGAEPGHPEADRFQRPYESDGHASESPMAGAPRQMPIIHAPQGYVQPIELPGAPVAGYVPAHVTQALSMGSPSDR